MSTPTATVPALDPKHDGRHALEDKPLERESMPYIISLPEHGIATCFYTWVTKDHKAGALFVVTGPGVGDEPIIEAVDDIDVGPSADFDDWTVGPVHISHALDLWNARLVGTGQRIALDATFTAIHPAYAYGVDSRGCPPFAATDRLEQSGRVRGTVTVDGRTYEFDTTGARDHSWGTRDWDHAQHWKWLHAQTQDTAVHFWQIFVAGEVELRGYVVRDGETSEVRDLDVAFTLDDQARQQTITATVTDALGRTATVTGEYFAWFHLPPVPTCTLVEGGMRAEIDGVPGSGWSEFMWTTSYLEHLREQSHSR